MKERAGTDAVIAAGNDVETKHSAIERPEAERASTLVATLGSGRASAEEVFAAFEELDELPPDLVREALSRWTGPAPDPEELDPTLRKVHGLPPRRLRLGTVAIVKDADVLDLGPVAEEQLRVAGRSWDGADLAPEERLDGERDDSFAGTLELRAVADVETGAPLFDVLLFCGDSGVVFRAGTTDQVGAIAYGKVEMTDRRARTALEDALSTDEVAVSSASAAEETASTEAPTETIPAKKATTKKAPAKKATTKKATTTAKKATAKKVTAKKAPAKKAAAAKTASPKKAPAKKPSAKKAASSRSLKD